LPTYPLGLLKFSRIAAGFAAIQTALCGILIVTRQTVVWFSTGELRPYRISSLIRDLSGDSGFVMASSESKVAAEGGSALWMGVFETSISIPLLLAFLFFLQLFGWLCMQQVEETRR
jgi:hypothetical protein